MSAKQPNAINLAIAVLQEAGYTVAPPGMVNRALMFTPTELCERFKLRANTLSRRLYSHACPTFFAEYTKLGLRIRRIQLTPELEDYLRKPLLH